MGQDITVTIRMVGTMEGQDLEDQEGTRVNLGGRQVGWCITLGGMGMVIMGDLEDREVSVDLKAGLEDLGGMGDMVHSMEGQEGVGCMEDQDMAGLDKGFSELL